MTFKKKYIDTLDSQSSRSNCIQGLGFSPNSDKPMSDVGSPGPITGTIGGGGGASPNPESMIASSSSVKSKFQ